MELTTRGERTIAAMRRGHDGLETAADHRGTHPVEAVAGRVDTGFTCAFAAPGVGLEPTTYGLTV
jgi:hypothetical protein